MKRIFKNRCLIKYIYIMITFHALDCEGSPDDLTWIHLPGQSPFEIRSLAYIA